MTSAFAFLLASRQCEIAELEQLARSCELVGAVARLVHALQRERGISNVFLSSRGQRFARQRREQQAECERAEAGLRQWLDALETSATPVGNGSRLFSRIALVLHALEGLPALRERITGHELVAAEATAAFSVLIASLLAVVFEAADSATDPDVSRALVALLHLMQGKEFAGQERALGARSFATGHIDAAGQQQWRHLIESQQSCLQVFADFSQAEGAPAGVASPPSPGSADLARLRHLGCTGDGALDSAFSDAWYETCTRRIDDLHADEDRLARHLRTLCERRIAQAREDLSDQRAVLDRLLGQARPVEPDAPAPLGRQLGRAVFEMAQTQSRRLQDLSGELEAARARLNDRKTIERAKGLLMAHRQISEDEAYKALRQLAMNQNKRLVDVAEALLSLAEVLPARDRPFDGAQDGAKKSSFG
ncbi:nitrate regulatory protein [Ramlibacter rhizophilus]|uniref:ANTAR domain-containing protein n=1 Tax=Ramlibacter rhizophilus TaxID=1781167 RepID=A0A4Z0C1D3_9BURK|nr:nitrate regulatory protein [Ramlibacter rhizophilus]TFZ04614.1 ANTAR domain-containing protein [Ramlibacter rhizophilus]